MNDSQKTYLNYILFKLVLFVFSFSALRSICRRIPKEYAKLITNTCHNHTYSVIPTNALKLHAHINNIGIEANEKDTF